MGVTVCHRVTQKRRWESNPLKAALQAAALPSGSSATSFSVLARSRTWSSTFARSRAIRNTPRTCFISAPCRGIEPRPAVSRTAMRSGTPAGLAFQVSRPGLEPGSGPSEGPMRSLAPSRRFLFQRPDQESNLVQGLRRALCDPLHHRDNQTRADDWICASIKRFTKPPPFSVEPRRQIKQECKDSNPVARLWRPLPLPGGHSCNRLRSRRTGGIGVTTTPSASRSSTPR